MCARALGEQDLALTQYRWFSETRFGRFFGGKKIAKGVCNVAKLATLCFSISPTTGRATCQTENTRCVNRALKKLVPLKWICVNALTLIALVWTQLCGRSVWKQPAYNGKKSTHSLIYNLNNHKQSLRTSSFQSHFRNMRGVAGINKNRLNWPQSASVAVSEPHCTADVCSVNCLSINGRESPLYSRAGTYEVILGGYGTLKNDYMTFYIRHVTCKREKNVSIAVLRNIPFSNCLKNHLMRA